MSKTNRIKEVADNKIQEIAKIAGDGERSEKKIADVESKGTVVIDHMEKLNEMLKLIEVSDIDVWEKQVLRIRLTHGYDESTLILMSLAQKWGIKWQVILNIEESGMKGIVEYLNKAKIEDAIGQFNSDSKNASTVKEHISKSGIVLDAFNKGVIDDA